ncbi:MAG: hypothetical protein J1E64_15185 [Acetatifactor sp.]|nr:hypothetical protein [Acetatifactor sp.]
MTLANYLYALVYSDLYDENKWQNWAENILKNAEYDDNTEWVYNVFLATGKQKLFDAIYERMYCEGYFNSHVLTEIIQGYYYYQYQSKAISLYDMLKKSGDVADAGQDSSMGCEFFYDLLNKIDEDSNIVDSVDFQEKILKYYEPLYLAAMEQKRKLESATLKDLKLDL